MINLKKLIKLAGRKAFASLMILSIACAGLFLTIRSASASEPELALKYNVTNNDDPNDPWDHDVTVGAGQTVKFYAEIHNTVIGSTANNVRIKAAVPSTSGTSEAKVSADNAASATDSVSLTINGGTLQYVPGSTFMTFDVDGDGVFESGEFNGTQMPDGIVGDGITVGNQKGCFEFIAQVSWKAKVVAQQQPAKGQIKIVKFNDKNGDGKRDSGEEGLASWNFDVDGPGSDDSVKTTGSDGTVTFQIATGQTTVREQTRAGWRVTTAASQTVSVGVDETKEVVFGNKQEEQQQAAGGGQTQSQSQTQNNSQTQNQTNNQTVNVSVPGAGQVAGASVPQKQPETGVGLLGMAAMFSAAPLGLILSRYGRGRLIIRKREELGEFAHGIFNARQSQKA